MLIDFRELFPRYNIKPQGVLHVGANVGEEAPVYNELGVTTQIWIEANPSLIERLNDNVSKNSDIGIVFNFAASDVDGEIELNIANNGGQSSSILELGTHRIAHPEVKYIDKIIVNAVRIDSILEVDTLMGADFLNIDVQGAELKVLKGIGDLLKQFKWAYLEVNREELYKGCALVGEIDAYLYHYGFERVETKWCGDTGWGDALYIKNYEY